MCVAIPYKVLEVSENGRAQIEVGSIRQEISTLLVPEVAVGDYVLVYLGCATAKIEEYEAIEVLSLFQEIAEAETLLDSYPLPEEVNERRDNNEWEQRLSQRREI